MTTPMLATLIDEPFDDPNWLFEVKFDGYRALGHKYKSVQLLSRGKQSFNHRFPILVEELKKLRGRFIVDGEIVILDKNGRSHFQLLQNYQTQKIAGRTYTYERIFFKLILLSLLELSFEQRLFKIFFILF